MGVSLGFLVAMVIVGGFVAYMGDYVGRKIGKKRLKVGRLRPMHTAMISTFIAGMLGTLVTILVLAAVSAPVRVWLLEGDKAKEDVSRLQGQVSDLEKQRDESSSLVNEQKKKINQGETRIAQTSQTLSERQRELERAKSDAQKLLAQRGELTNRVKTIQTSAERIKKSNELLKKEGKALEQQIREGEAGLQKTQGDNASLQRMNAKLTTSNTQLEDQIEKNKGLIDELQRTIENLNKALENQTIENRAQLQKYVQELNAAKFDLEQTNIDLEERRRQIENFQKAFTKENLQSRFQPLIYSLGDEVARTPIAAQTSRATVEKVIEQALVTAGSSARTRGAGRNANGTYVTVLGILGTSVNAELRPAEYRAKEEELIRAVTAKPRDYLLVINTFANAFKEEATTVVINVVANPVVYRAGDMILELQIDGTLSEDAIIDRIFSYLQENLPKTVISKGMIPARGQDAPLGEVTRDQILQMADRVRQSGRRLRLQILAAEDTRAGDKLRIDYRLRI